MLGELSSSKIEKHNTIGKLNYSCFTANFIHFLLSSACIWTLHISHAWPQLFPDCYLAYNQYDTKKSN